MAIIRASAFEFVFASEGVKQSPDNEAHIVKQIKRCYGMEALVMLTRKVL